MTEWRSDDLERADMALRLLMGSSAKGRAQTYAGGHGAAKRGGFSPPGVMTGLLAMENGKAGGDDQERPRYHGRRGFTTNEAGGDNQDGQRERGRRGQPAQPGRVSREAEGPAYEEQEGQAEMPESDGPGGGLATELSRGNQKGLYAEQDDEPGDDTVDGPHGKGCGGMGRGRWPAPSHDVTQGRASSFRSWSWSEANSRSSGADKASASE
jgi:hypothetical protein